MPPVLKFSVRGEARTFVLDKDEAVVGRATDCDIQVAENAVSRRHARFHRDGVGTWRVLDLGSRNGTRINNLPGTDKVLEDGDRIHLPEIVLTFLDADSPRSAPSPLDDAPVSPAMQTMFRTAVDFAALASAQRPAAAAGTEPSGRLQRLVKVVSEASRAVLLSGSLDQTFQRMLDIVFENLPVQRGFIMLRDRDGRLAIQCVKHAGGPAGEIRFSRTIAERVVEDKVAVLTLDAQSDRRFSSGESIMALGIRSAMAAPLWNGEQVDGLICVDTALQTKAFDEFDLDLLSALGNHLAVAIEQARLQRVALEKERLDRDLSVARDIQLAFLPATMPACPGYDLAGRSRPAEQTGGDVFDVVPLEAGRLMLLLGDATGHGIGPALSVTQVRSMLRIAVRLGADLDSAFRQINNQLAADLADNRFVTAFLGVLDPGAHEICYHSGGQGPILHFRAATGECVWLKATTTPLGFMETVTLKPSQTLALAPGDVLGLITDGVFEYEDPAEEQFQTERVAEVIRRHHERPMSELVTALLAAVDEFGQPAPQKDDITIVLVRRLPGS